MKKITVFKGDGIGPEITDAVLKILEAAKAPLEYEVFRVGLDEYEAVSYTHLTLPTNSLV